MEIAAAGNTEVPAYLALVDLGFKISVRNLEKGAQIWTAAKNDLQVSGESPLELLALIKLIECRGENWKASDDEINDFLSKYC